MNDSFKLRVLIELADLRVNGGPYSKQYRSLRQTLARENPNLSELRDSFEKQFDSETAAIKSGALNINPKFTDIKAALVKTFPEDSRPELETLLLGFGGDDG